MNVQEAIKRLLYLKNKAEVTLLTTESSCEWLKEDVKGTIESLGMAIRALEKQIPKKPIKWADGTEHCPCCDLDNSAIGYGVCIDCGQKLDWSE